jgi:hypothetical protein
MVEVPAEKELAPEPFLVGRIVGRYGGEEYVAVDVSFGDRHYQLFSPKDLEEISSPQPWWRSLLDRESRS